MIVLKDWFLKEKQDVWRAPEKQERYLGGKVYGHPKFEDGKEVRTSPVVSVKGREITTGSGSVYLLEGPPRKEYLEWLNEQKITIDSDNPIRMLCK